jgi:glycosyltransferase involved in cell wall biosynthesis
MWKARPVVAGRDGGLALQVVDGKTGLLAETTEAFGLRLVDLLHNEGARLAMGAAGRERIRRGMLIIRCLRDYLALFQSYA